MKVVISGYVGKKITGIGRNIISLVDNCLDNIDFVFYVPFDSYDDFSFKNTRVIVKKYKVTKNSSLKNLMWTTFCFPKMVKKERADIALIPNFTLLLKKSAPTIVIMHDLIEFNVANKFSKLKMFYRTKLADPITAKKADHIITVSDNSKKDIIHFLKIASSKISVVKDGVDFSKFHNLKMDDVSSAFFKEKQIDSNYLLYVGTIDHPGKNVITVLKVFERLKENQQFDGKCVLAGMPGKGYEFVFDYAQKSRYSKDIIFLGYVDDLYLPYLYSNCSVFLFLSLYEGFGIPPLEALACGAKVVVSNTSSLPEVVGKYGKCVNPMNIEEIQDAIIDSIDSKENNKYEIGLYLDDFDWRNISKDFINVLRGFNYEKS